MSSTFRAVALLVALSGMAIGTAQAQGASCPPGMKHAAGACVRTCPGGFEDRGDTCVYRNQSR